MGKDLSPCFRVTSLPLVLLSFLSWIPDNHASSVISGMTGNKYPFLPLPVPALSLSKGPLFPCHGDSNQVGFMGI